MFPNQILIQPPPPPPPPRPLSFGSLTSTRQSFPSIEAGNVSGYTPSMISAMPVAFAYDINEVKELGVGPKEVKSQEEFKRKVEDILEEHYGMVYTEQEELVSLRQLREGGMKKRKNESDSSASREGGAERKVGDKEREAAAKRRGEAMRSDRERKLTYDQSWEFSATRCARKAGGGTVVGGGEIDTVLLRREEAEGGGGGWKEVRVQVRQGRGFGKVVEAWVDGEGRRFSSLEEMVEYGKAEKEEGRKGEEGEDIMEVDKGEGGEGGGERGEGEGK